MQGFSLRPSARRRARSLGGSQALGLAFRNLTPGSSPLLNSIRAISKACWMTLSVARRGCAFPSSNIRTVATPTPAASASCS
jgi:hypothetical protein